MMLRNNKKRPFSYGGNLYEPYKSNEWYTQIGLPLYAFGLAMNNIGGSLKPKGTSTMSGGTGNTEGTTDPSKGFEVGASTTDPFGYEAAYGGNLYPIGGWMNISDMSTKTGKVLGGAGSVLGMAGAGFQGFSGSASMNDAAINAALQGSIRAATKKVSSNSFDSLMKDWSNFRTARTDYRSRDFRSSDGQRAANTLGSVASGAMAGPAFGPVGAIVGGAVGLGSSIAGMITGNSKARRQARLANRTNTLLNAANTDKYLDRANMLRKSYNRALSRSFVADGGELNFGLYLNGFANGGTLFTMPQVNTALGYALVNQALLNNKEEGKPFQFGFGGNLGTNGSNFTDGLTYFNVPTRHETNPNGGIPLGIAPDGKPNLVEGKEENKKGDGGEIKWNKLEYIFSDRLTPSQALIDRWKLPKLFLEYTYADVVRKSPIVKEAELRPNHPESLDAMDLFLASVAEDQETTKKEKEAKEMQDQISLMSDLEVAALGMLMAQLKQLELQEPEELSQKPVDYQQLEEGDQLDYLEDLEALALMATQDGMAQPYVGAALGGHLNADGGDMTAQGESIPALTLPEIIDLPATAPELMNPMGMPSQPMASPMAEPLTEMPLEAPVEEETSQWDSYPEAAEMSTKQLNQAIEDITVWARENKDKLMLRDARRAKKGSREDKEEFVDESLDIIREEEQFSKQEALEQATPVEQPQEAAMPQLMPQMMAEGGEMAPTEETALVPLEEMSADTDEPLPASIEEILNLLLQLSELLGISAEEEYTPQTVELLLLEALKLGMDVSALEALGPAKTANLLNQFKALLASQTPELQPQQMASPELQMQAAGLINPLEAMMAALLEDQLQLLGIPFGFGGAFALPFPSRQIDSSLVIEELKQTKDVKDISTTDIANVLLLNETQNRLLGYLLPVIYLPREYRYGGKLAHKFLWGGFEGLAKKVGFTGHEDAEQWLRKNHYWGHVKRNSTLDDLRKLAIALLIKNLQTAGHLPSTVDQATVNEYLEYLLTNDPQSALVAAALEKTVTKPVKNEAPTTPVTPKKQEIQLAALTQLAPQGVTPVLPEEVDTEDEETGTLESQLLALLNVALNGATATERQEAQNLLNLYLQGVGASSIEEAVTLANEEAAAATPEVSLEALDTAQRAVLRYYKQQGFKEEDLLGIQELVNEDIRKATEEGITSVKDFKQTIKDNPETYHISKYSKDTSSKLDILLNFNTELYNRNLVLELRNNGAAIATINGLNGNINRNYYNSEGVESPNPTPIGVIDNPITYDAASNQWVANGQAVENPFTSALFKNYNPSLGRDWSTWGYIDPKDGEWHDVEIPTTNENGNTELKYKALKDWFTKSGMDINQYESSDAYLNNYLDFIDDIYAGNKSALQRLYDLGEISKDKNGKNRYFKEGVNRDNLSISDILQDEKGNYLIGSKYVTGGDSSIYPEKQFYRNKDGRVIGPKTYEALSEEEKKEYTPLDHKGLTREERLDHLRTLRNIYPLETPVNDDRLFSAMFDNNAALAYLMGKPTAGTADLHVLVNSKGEYIDLQGNVVDTPVYVDYLTDNPLYSLYGAGPLSTVTDSLGNLVNTYGVQGGDAPMHLMQVGDLTLVLTDTLAKKYQLAKDQANKPKVAAPVTGYTGDVTWHTYDPTTPVKPTKKDEEQEPKDRSKINWNALAGLAPFLNRPFLDSYSSANQLAGSADNLTWMSAPRHGEYARYTPIDAISKVNELREANANQLNGIMNMANGNSSLGLANMAYTNALNLRALADLNLGIEDKNAERKMAVINQHNDVDKTWDAYALLADQANMGNNQYIQNAAVKAADRNYEIENSNNDSLSKWWSNVLSNVQARAYENKLNQLFLNAMLSGIGAPGSHRVYEGIIGGTNQGITDTQIHKDTNGEYFMENGKKVYFKRSVAQGGELVIKRKRRLQ